MRIRSIKPEFWRSEDITALDWEARLVFVGVWSYVDDNGVGKDRLADIAADLFAGDLELNPPETFARVSRGLQSLSDRGLITRYSHNRKRWLYVTNWPLHQRIDKPNKARFPLPDGRIATPSRDTPETPAPGTGEQRNRGTEESLVTPVSQSQTVTREVDNDGLTRIRELTKGTEAHARKCAEFVLAKAPTNVRNPTAYVIKAITADPDAFRFKRGNPKRGEDCPTHIGEWADACRGCAADRKGIK